MAAERDTINRLIAHHLSERVGEEFDGRVAGVTKAGLFVALPQFGADGFVPISTLGTDYFLYDEAHQALTGKRRVSVINSAIRFRCGLQKRYPWLVRCGLKC